MRLAWFSVSLPLVLSWALAPPISPSREKVQDNLQSAKHAMERYLIAQEESSWRLAIQREAASYKALHSREFFTVSGDGETDRAKSEASALDPNVNFDRCDLSAFRVRVVEMNTAIVTYHVQATGTDHGKAFYVNSYASSIWVRRGGKWLDTFYQATPAANR
jgi:hypothetical protein